MVLPVYTLFEREAKTTTEINPPKNKNNDGFSSSWITCFFASYLWLQPTSDVPMLGSKIRKCRCCCIFSHFLLRNYNMLMLRSKSWKGIRCCLLDHCWLFNYDVLMSRSKIRKGICCSLFGHCWILTSYVQRWRSESEKGICYYLFSFFLFRILMWWRRDKKV